MWTEMVGKALLFYDNFVWEQMAAFLRLLRADEIVDAQRRSGLTSSVQKTSIKETADNSIILRSSRGGIVHERNSDTS